MAGTPYTLLFEKSDTLASSMSAGATSFTLTSGNFGSPSGTQVYVIDYDVPASAEVVSATVVTTAGSAVTRGLDSTTGVAHSAGAKVGAFFVPSHYNALKLNITTSDTYVDATVTTAAWTSLSVNKSFTTTGGKVTATFTVNSYQQGSSASTFAQIRLKRGSTVLRTSAIFGGMCNATDTNVRVPHTLTVQETPAAGTYTYDIELINTNAVGTINIADSNLLLIESAV